MKSKSRNAQAQTTPVQPNVTSDDAKTYTVADALRLADEHKKQGRLPQAENVLRQLLAQRPKTHEALHGLALIAHQVGQTKAAVQLIQNAITIDPHVALYHGNIAEMYRLIGQPEKAIEYGKAALGLRPDHADTYNNLGIAYFDLGDYEGAIKHYEHALRLRPTFAEAFSNRGNALRQLKRFDEAEPCYRKAIELKPDYAEAYNNLGSVLRDLERPADAEDAYRTALKRRPGYVDAMNNLILALKDLKRFDEGLALANQVLRIQPQNADALCYSGSILVEQKEAEKALSFVKQAIAIQPNKAEYWNMMGRAQFENLQPEQSIVSYQKAISLKPTFSDPYNNMGNALKELGRFDEALAAFEKCLELAPDAHGAYVNLVDAKKFKSDDDVHLKAMETYLARGESLEEEKQMHLNFGLAKAYDDLKRYDEAFAHMSRGCTLKRKTIDYKEDEVLVYFDRIKAQITRETVEKQSGNGFKDATPIFVVGMPRSGTTLIEQIIASHPRVRGAGELKDMNETVLSVRDKSGNQAPHPEFLNVVRPEELAKIGEVYVRRLRRHAPAAERITDKMPSNFYYTALIHLALPNARIIHSMRNPVDTCVSCFSKLFAGEQSQTYDLGELGRYYRSYHDLMQHWREVLPEGTFLDVQYENVVEDIETQARRILDYCGLEWSPRVLDFHKNERPVKTASASQVRQPVYSSSVARWRNYEKHLGVLLTELGDLAK